MADASDVLKEFVVSIGFDIDEKKLRDTGDKIQKSLAGMADAAEAAFTGLIEGLGAVVGAVTGAFFAIDRFVDGIAKRFETLFYQAQRAGTSVSSLFSIQRAGASIGLQNLAETATQFGQGLTVTNPAIRNLIEGRFGIQTEGRDPTRVMLDFVKEMRTMIKGGQGYQATQYGQMVGIDPNTLIQMANNYDKLNAEYEENLKHTKEMDEQTRKMVAYRQAVQDFNTNMQELGGTLASKAAPGLAKFYKFLSDTATKLMESPAWQHVLDELTQSFEWLITYIVDHGPEIDKTIMGAIDLLKMAADYIKHSIEEFEWLSKRIKEFFTWLSDHTPAWLKKFMGDTKKTVTEGALPPGQTEAGQKKTEQTMDSIRQMSDKVASGIGKIIGWHDTAPPPGMEGEGQPDIAAQFDAGTLPAVIPALAKAIAQAEGYGASATNVPTRAMNPGDLTGVKGLETTGPGHISVFHSIEEGWQALFQKLQNILAGKSKVYSAGMTLEEFGKKWVGEAGYMNWVKTVSKALGVSSTTTLSELSHAMSVPLTSARGTVAAAGGKSVGMNQQTTINVYGHDAHETARLVAQQQKAVNNDAQRNLQKKVA